MCVRVQVVALDARGQQWAETLDPIMKNGFENY